MSETIAMLEVARAEFIESVTPFLKVMKRVRAGEEAILSFDGSFLTVEFGGGGLGIPAKGMWRGQARVPANFVHAMMKAAPAGSPIVFKVSDGRLYAGSASIGCEWQSEDAKKIDVPMNAGPLDYLRISETYTDEELRAAGLLKLIKLAREGRDERIENALRYLNVYGITADDLKAYLRERALADAAKMK